MMAISADEVLEFWFAKDFCDAHAILENSKRWFKKDDAFDREIRTRFGELPEKISTGIFNAWLSTKLLCSG